MPILFQIVREAPLLWCPCLCSQVLWALRSWLGAPVPLREGFLLVSSIQTLLSLSHPTLHPLRVHQDLSCWQNRSENHSPSHQGARSRPPLVSLSSTHPLLALACLPFSPLPLAPGFSVPPSSVSLQLASWDDSSPASLKASAGLSVPASLHSSLAVSLPLPAQVAIVSKVGVGRRDRGSSAVVACPLSPPLPPKAPLQTGAVWTLHISTEPAACPQDSMAI